MTSAPAQLRFVREGAAVYLTTDRVLLVRGDDARTWLNGQITNEVRDLHGDRGLYALATTTKGRVVSDLWALEHEAGMALVLPERTYQAAFAILDKHVIMEDVELVPAPQLRVVTVQGPKAAEVTPSTGVLRRYTAHRLTREGIDLWLEESAMPAALTQLAHMAQAQGGGLLDDAGWTHAHLALSVPRAGVDFGEQSYPQEAGLKERTLSFQKGCYRGQEVIYMLENRGHLARRLVVLDAPAGAATQAGAALEADGKRVGELTSVDVTPSPEGTTLVMGYVKRAFAEVGQVVTLAGVPCTVRSVVGVTDECPLVAR